MSRALVVGLARSGTAAAALLAREGWDVVAVDARAVEVPEDLLALGVEVRAPFSGSVPGVDLVVKSPGVPPDVVPVAAARAAGVPVWSEVELGVRHLPNRLLAITGTNGKTTTTELTAHLLRAAGIPAVACGNQGTPVAGLVGVVDPAAWLVVEVAAFQLEDVHAFSPRGAVLLNLTPDHTDRFRGLDDYLAAKLNAFRAQRPDDLAILPPAIPGPGPAPARRLAARAPAPGEEDEVAAWEEGGLHVAGLGHVIDWDDVPLRGRHNRQNVMAAAALAAHAGAGRSGIAAGLRAFAGVPHRLERVGRAGGVSFVNDSKATNPEATVAALDAYPAGVHLIAGGRSKATPFAPMARAARGAVVRAYLIGEAAVELGAALTAAGVPHETAGDLDAAVAAAARRARPGEVVLLAPGCASYDQFADFEARGDAFRKAAEAAGAR